MTGFGTKHGTMVYVVGVKAGLVTMVMVLEAVGMGGYYVRDIAMLLACDWLLERCRTVSDSSRIQWSVVHHHINCIIISCYCYQLSLLVTWPPQLHTPFCKSSPPRILKVNSSGADPVMGWDHCHVSVCNECNQMAHRSSQRVRGRLRMCDRRLPCTIGRQRRSTI